MARVHSSVVLLVVIFVSVLDSTEATVQRIIHREEHQVKMSYWYPKSYPCMEDWNKICEQDSDCCSGSCLAMFCKILGLEAPTTLRPHRRSKLSGKGKRKGKGKSREAPKDYSDRTGQNRIKKKRVQ